MDIDILRQAGYDVDAALRCCVTTEFYERMLNVYLSGTESIMGKLRNARDTGATQGIFDAAHELKGVSGNLGLMPLFRACSSVVENVRTGNLEALPESVEVMIRENDTALKVIQRSLGKEG